VGVTSHGQGPETAEGGLVRVRDTHCLPGQVYSLMRLEGSSLIIRPKNRLFLQRHITNVVYEYSASPKRELDPVPYVICVTQTRFGGGQSGLGRHERLWIYES